MKIAMTHDQADFDAIASLFAASKIEGAQAVLPQKMNRNVNSFLNLYGTEFQFLENNDANFDEIDDVILVDTQSLLTIKGISKKTRIQVIDHHPLRVRDGAFDEKLNRSVQPERSVEIVDLGATTTYFTEEMQRKRVAITPAQATLMLLAIYEDTGSLTYSKTTARDVRAVAWLIDQGAMLQSISDFLNPPMSDQQIVVYDLLLDNMEHFQVKGHRVMLSYADVPVKVDEISTLAHKIRDLFEPDAVFIIVKTPEGIRMIARSSNDDINVAEIAAQFGGGGHQRAASALLKPEKYKLVDIPEIKKQLHLFIDQKIKPSVTVAKLMSKMPKVLSPDTSVNEAGQLMLKYGYEGFPVVEDGKVIGLLTRRSVDRAKKHNLKVNVVNIMDAGSYSVEPSDPIQTVQMVMTESGWGQIPVIDPTTKKLIGIVTRTDLIKILASKRRAFSSGKNIENKLTAYLSPEVVKLVNDIAKCCAAQSYPAYLVGGFVRDLLLDYPSTDIDCVIEGEAISIGEKLVEQYGGRLTSHRRFGTARWFLFGSNFQHPSLPEFIDLISARQEFYEQPSALPSVEYGNIKHDLHRRDFTINTLAIRIDPDHYGELHDYYGGKSDLDKKVIRVLHSLSFVDDPTRMIRAARYKLRYGFTIDERTMQLMAEAKQLLGHLSAERLRHELDLILLESDPVAILDHLRQWKLFEEISPALIWDNDTNDRMNEYLKVPLLENWPGKINLTDEHNFNAFSYCLWFAMLSSDQINEIQQHLGFPVKLFNQIIQTSKLTKDISTGEIKAPSEWVSLLEGIDGIPLYVAYILTKEQAILDYLTIWKNIHTKVDGDALRTLGLKPGPSFQKIINAVKEARLNGIIQSDDEEKGFLLSIIKEQGNQDRYD
jgi:tRNA nucleotidyltransferase (CCA-adding enzyme)